MKKETDFISVCAHWRAFGDLCSLILVDLMVPYTSSGVLFDMICLVFHVVRVIFCIHSYYDYSQWSCDLMGQD